MYTTGIPVTDDGLKKMKDIDVSIVIPVYNVEDYIGECIESVISQDTKYKIECILVDDRGNDRSVEYAHKVTDAYSGDIDFRYITHDRNKGLSGARNTGIREAKGRYLFLLDSDDIITPDCIGSLMKMTDLHPGVQIVTGDNQTFPEEGLVPAVRLAGKNFPDYSDDRRWIRSVLLNKFPVIACNKLFKIDFLKDNNLYFKEGIVHEDNYWHIQAYDKIESVAFVKKVTYLYRIRKESITSDPMQEGKRLDARIAICRELVSNNIKWEVGWAKSVRNELCFLRYYPLESERGTEARRLFQGYIDAIQKNHGAPLAMKLLFAYWGRKTPGRNEVVFNTLFNLYWCINDIVRFRRPML